MSADESPGHPPQSPGRHRPDDPEARPAVLNLSALPVGPGERRRVLVVDDEPGMRYMARRALEPRFEVTEAESGEEALRILESRAFHVAIVDVRLPGISGLDLLSALKAVSPSIDVIVMTGSAVDTDEALEWAIRRKAFFFLRKPFPVTVLETLVERVAETQDLEERLVGYARALERALENARIFQRRLLPPSPWNRPDLRIASNYRASERLSGDFFDYWELSGRGSAIVIADVMGHGPSAAMVTGIVKSQLRRLADEIADPGEVLTALEEELTRIALPSFLTALLIFDRPDQGVIEYAGAGHAPGLLLPPGALSGSSAGPPAAPVPPQAVSPSSEPAAGPAIASGAGLEQAGASRTVNPPFFTLVSRDIPINTGLPIPLRTATTLTRSPGSRLLLFTDGYSEARNRAGMAFDGMDGGSLEMLEPGGGPTMLSFTLGSPFAAAAFAALSASSPEAGIHTFEQAWETFTEGTIQDDDRAAVLAWIL